MSESTYTKTADQLSDLVARARGLGHDEGIKHAQKRPSSSSGLNRFQITHRLLIELGWEDEKNG